MKRGETNMKGNKKLRNVAVTAFMGMMAVIFAPLVQAAQQSTCLICHLCEPMLVKNRSVVMPTVSSMQSGAG